VAAAFSGLELLATAVVALDEHFVVHYANPAAENLLATGAKSLIGQPFLALFSERAELERSLAEARGTHWDYAAQNVTYTRGGREPLPLSCVVTRIDAHGLALLAELRPIEEQLRYAREERLLFEQQANRELIRNLAHEIKNPLGGLRGSAQLLERELDKPDLREYTQVIIKEADRLQALMDRASRSSATTIRACRSSSAIASSSSRPCSTSRATPRRQAAPPWSSGPARCARSRS
jgi:two-component system nitrogen regulation sensor histidine kinase GlnL